MTVPQGRFHPGLDTQKSLKILQFRFGRKVGFRPVAVLRGVRYYPVDGQLRAESEIVSWTEVPQTEIGSH